MAIFVACTDFVHVSDVVEANILLANHDFGDTNLLTRIFNVGTGKNYSVNWIASHIENNHNNIIHIPPRVGEARDTIADNSKIINTLNWTPTISLEDYIKYI